MVRAGKILAIPETKNRVPSNRKLANYVEKDCGTNVYCPSCLPHAKSKYVAAGIVLQETLVRVLYSPLSRC